MLKTAKIAALRSARSLGVFSAVKQSQWRNERLLILCYHGISMGDEHVWSPGLYIPPDQLRRRLQLLRDGGYNVLPLDEAIRRLGQGGLPPRSVVLTFDDGAYNFHQQAFPILKEFGFPATVYLSTYYCRKQMPVFDLAAAYVLWKGEGKTIDWQGLTAEGGTGRIEPGKWRKWYERVRRFVSGRGLSADEKDALGEELSSRLGIVYEGFRRDRTFHLMKPEEVAEIAGAGVSVELHTHRHRTPRERELWFREIGDNRREILEISGRNPAHFCYPSGDYVPEYFNWLRESEVLSATTCEAGFAATDRDPMKLPRILDTCWVSAVEFEGWLTGVCAALPRR